MLKNAEQLSYKDTTVVVLRDIKEDTDIVLKQLLNTSFFDNQVKVIEMLAYHENIDYYSYIKNIGVNVIIIMIRIINLRHNRDLIRLKIVTSFGKV